MEVVAVSGLEAAVATRTNLTLKMIVKRCVLNLQEKMSVTCLKFTGHALDIIPNGTMIPTTIYAHSSFMADVLEIQINSKKSKTAKLIVLLKIKFVSAVTRNVIRGYLTSLVVIKNVLERS